MDTSESQTERASFQQMAEGTAEDWQIIMRHHEPFARALPDRVLLHLGLLGGDFGGFAVDRLTHSLQTATRALLDGRDEEYVVCALLHDIGDTLCPNNHPDLAAAILKPFVSERNHWIVEKHGVFQGYYFWHLIGGDRNARDRYRSHQYFDDTAEFCELYDQRAFEPKGETLPLVEFEPMVRRVLGPRA